jgi:hypothetical protein
MNKLKYIAAVMIAVAGLGLHQAKADVFTSSLNQGNTGISGFTGPFGTVTVTLIDPTHASITWTNNTVNGNTYLFGDGGAVAANISSSFLVTSITGTGPNSAPILSQQAAGNEDGFGTMNLKITDFDGFSFAASSVTVALTNTSGTWASAADVLAFNAQGFDAGAHIFVTTNGGTTNTSITGFAGEGTGTPGVPDGGTTVMLLGAALGALGMARRFLMS